MQRLPLAILALLLLTLLWWLFAADRSPAPPAAPTNPAQTTAPRPRAAPSDAAQAPASSTAERTDTQSAATAAPAGADEVRGPQADVLVRDRDSQRPVAGAEVRWVPAPAMLARGRPRGDLVAEMRLADDYQAATQGTADVYITDADGRARVPAPAGGAIVTVRHQDSYGEAMIRGTRPTAVWLAPDRTLRVRVVDAAGATQAGASVALTRPGHDTARRGPPSAFVRETDEQGIATWHHAQRLLWSVYDDLDSARVAKWQVAIQHAGLAPEPTDVDTSALPADPITLTLPSSGDLRVRLLVAGKPLRLPEWAFPPGYALLQEGTGRPISGRRRMRRADQDGWIEFRGVGLGKTFSLGQRGWQCEVEGPQAAGETVAHEVELGEQFPFVSAKLIGLDSAPVVGGDADLVLLDEEDQMLTSLSAAVEASGRVCIMVPPRIELGEVAGLQLRWRGEGEEELASPTQAATLRGGVNDLGALPLRPRPLAVAGHVELDTPDTRVQRLEIERFRAPADGAAGEWDYYRNLTVELAPDRTFAAHGELGEGRYRLKAVGSNLVSAPVEFTRGQRDVVVRAGSGCSLEVHCQVPDSLRLGQLLVEVVHADGEAHSVTPFPRPDRPGFVIGTTSQLAPGTCDVELRWQDRGSDPLHTISGVALQSTEEPTKVEVDVRPYLTQLEVELRVAGGADLPHGAGLFAGPPPADGTWIGEPLKVGRKTVSMRRGFGQLTVAAPGCRPAQVQPSQGALQVTLEPWPTATVTVSGLETLPPDTITRLAATVPEGGDDGRQYWMSSVGGRVRDLLEGGSDSGTLTDGRMSVRVGLRPLALAVTVAPPDSDERIPVRALSITEIAGPGDLVVTVPPEEAARLLEALRK